MEHSLNLKVKQFWAARLCSISVDNVLCSISVAQCPVFHQCCPMPCVPSVLPNGLCSISVAQCSVFHQCCPMPCVPSVLPNEMSGVPMQCYTQYNEGARGGYGDFPLCSVEMVADMKVAGDTQTCRRRGMCLRP